MTDRQDYELIVKKVLLQAMDDYVKLHHPKQRQKKYLKEAFWSAVDLFWDKGYRSEALLNENGEAMSLEDILKVASDRENVEPLNIKDWLIKETVSFWAKRELPALTIPNEVLVAGHVYYVFHHKEPSYLIDYEDKTVRLNKKTHAGQLAFFEMLTELVCYHSDIRVSTKARNQLSKGWFQLMQINDCFSNSQEKKKKNRR